MGNQEQEVKETFSFGKLVNTLVFWLSTQQARHYYWLIWSPEWGSRAMAEAPRASLAGASRALPPNIKHTTGKYFLVF